MMKDMNLVSGKNSTSRVDSINHYIVEKYPNTANRVIAAHLNITISAVKNRARALGLVKSTEYKRKMPNHSTWPQNTIDRLRFLYPNNTNTSIAKILGLSLSQIKNKASNLGLKKSMAHMNDAKKVGRFVKGNVPYYKGKKGIRLSPATEFKKGQKPWNTKYDGCITTRFYADKGPRRWIRISEKVWQPLNRWVWEKHKGIIPAGHIVAFIDGNSMNANIDNLKCMSRANDLNNKRPENYIHLTREQKYKILIELTKKLRSDPALTRPETYYKSIQKTADRLKIKLNPGKRGRKAKPESQAKKLKLIRRRNITSKPIKDFSLTGYSNSLMDMGSTHLSLALKFCGFDKDKAKDAVMNSVMFFLESNSNPTSQEFEGRLIYECKLLMKDSYRNISIHDIEYKLADNYAA